MTAYYNENDPGAAAWLRELINAGAIAPGTVDERSIADVRPDDLTGFEQHHFFAGIGVWSYAMRLAGWPDDRPVWTGSCPCQPFSQAGRGLGTQDERHLWPVWCDLIRECRPPTIFGEQVASPAAMHWLAAVQTDLEGEGYAVAPFDLPAASVGAPHTRQRLFFVADRSDPRLEVVGEQHARLQFETAERGGTVGDMPNHADKRCREGGQDAQRITAGDCSKGLASGPLSSSHANSYWGGSDWIYCRDEKYRPVEPGTFPLVNGAPARVGRLRGYGNAIVAPLAAEFIAAYMSIAGRAR